MTAVSSVKFACIAKKSVEVPKRSPKGRQARNVLLASWLVKKAKHEEVVKLYDNDESKG